MYSVTRRDNVRSDYIRGSVKVGSLEEEKVQESRPSWYGHVQRRDKEYVGKRIEVGIEMMSWTGANGRGIWGKLMPTPFKNGIKFCERRKQTM